MPFAKDAKPIKGLLEIVEFVKPTAIIGINQTNIFYCRFS